MNLFRDIASHIGTKRSRLVRAGASAGDRVPLSAFDLLTGQIYTPRAFFYERTLDGAALAASLARTLQRFSVLAGRLRSDPRGGLHVVCNDAGVRFVEADSPVPMPAYGPGHPAKRDFSGFVEAVNPLWVVDRDTPLLTIKLTHMAGGGSVLGACIAHGLVDGTSYMAFMETHYFGNCVSHTTPTLAAGDLRAESLGEVALAVRRGLDDNTLEKLRGEIAFLVAHRESGLGGKVLPRMVLDAEGATVTFNNWSKLPFYALDFGGGAPFWYDVPTFPIPWLTLVAPTPSEDGGRDVHVAVPVEKLAAYRSRSWQALLHRHDEHAGRDAVPRGAAHRYGVPRAARTSQRTSS